MNMEDNQWQLSGDCKKCRRQNYCSKKCTAWKRRQDRIICEVASSIFNRTIDGKYSGLKR